MTGQTKQRRARCRDDGNLGDEMSLNSNEKAVFVDLTEGREAVVNGIATGGFWGSQHILLLSSSRVGVGPDGEMRPETAIVARLRFDTEVARQIRDALDGQLKTLEAPPRETGN